MTESLEEQLKKVTEELSLANAKIQKYKQKCKDLKARLPQKRPELEEGEIEDTPVKKRKRKNISNIIEKVKKEFADTSHPVSNPQPKISPPVDPRLKRNPLLSSAQRTNRDKAPVFQATFTEITNIYLSGQGISYIHIESIANIMADADPILMADLICKAIKLDSLNFNDATHISFEISRRLLGKGKDWDSKFFKEILKHIALEPFMHTVYSGSYNYCNHCYYQGSNHVEALNVSYVLLARRFNSIDLFRCLIKRVFDKKKMNLVHQALNLWPGCTLHTFRTIKMLFEKSSELFSYLTEAIRSTVEENYKDTYTALKCLFRSQTGESNYEFYKDYLWKCLAEAKKFSYVRITILESLGVLSNQIGNIKRASALNKQLEEILSDDDFNGKLYLEFSFSEQKAAFKALNKAKYQSSLTHKWRASNLGK